MFLLSGAALAGSVGSLTPEIMSAVPSLAAGESVPAHAAGRTPPPAGSACRFMDPEDDKCYPSADAADLAWLARTNTVPAAQLADSLPVEEDPDDTDEDGGGLDPVDSPSTHPAPTAAELLADPAKRSFWKTLATRVTDFVVRKSDSRPVSLPEEELAKVFATGFPMPLEHFPLSKLKDSFFNSRGRHRKHHAIDLPAPRGTPLVAVVDGTIERLGRDRRGGKVVYLRDESGKYIFFYAHLARHAKGLKVGDHVVKGERIGEVGSTGHVIGGPHLHFAIFRDDERESTWKRGVAVNPSLIFSTRLLH